MEQHRDEHLDCTDCGASFVFSAAEAGVFAERGLTPPKRCKECRRARKERAAGGGEGGHRGAQHGGQAGNVAAGNAGNVAGAGARGSRGPWNGAARAPQRRYTGDVNEYRSPMADGASGPSYGATPQASFNPRADRGAPSRAGASAPWRNGEYRSPMPDGFDRGAPAQGAPAFRGPGPRQARDDRGVRPGGARASSGSGGQASAPRTGDNSRRRPPAELFAVTCDACGAQAQVPFKPAEGREVFCPTCYKARRPAS